MHSDIIPPKKKSITKIKPASDIEVRIPNAKDLKEIAKFTPYKKTYHTVDGRDVKSKWPIVIFVTAVLVLGGVLYSKYNHTTTFTFTPKTLTFEVNEKIALVSAGTSVRTDAIDLEYSLVYIPDDDVSNLSNENATQASSAPNPFDEVKATTSTTTQTAPKTKPVYTEGSITSTSTNTTKNVYFINRTGSAVTLRETTRVSVGDVVYNLDKGITIKPTTDTTKFETQYKIVGFKGMSEYDKVFAVSKEETSSDEVNTSADVAIVDTTAIPPSDIISLLPATSLPLAKSNIYDKLLDQNAVVVIEQKDLESVVQKVNPGLQEYWKNLTPFVDILKYNIAIINYDLEVSAETGRPIGFRKLVLEITPVVNTEKSKHAFVGFSNDALKKIQSQVNQYIDFKVTHFPFWMTDVPVPDMVRIEVIKE